MWVNTPYWHASQFGDVCRCILKWNLKTLVLWNLKTLLLWNLKTLIVWNLIEWNRMDVILVCTIMTNLFPTLYFSISIYTFSSLCLSLHLSLFIFPSLSHFPIGTPSTCIEEILWTFLSLGSLTNRKDDPQELWG